MYSPLVYSWHLSELCLIDQNCEEVHNLQSPDEEKNGAIIRIGQEIRCLPYEGFFS